MVMPIGKAKKQIENKKPGFKKIFQTLITTDGLYRARKLDFHLLRPFQEETI